MSVCLYVCVCMYVRMYASHSQLKGHIMKHHYLVVSTHSDNFPSYKTMILYHHHHDHHHHHHHHHHPG